jgi:PGF-CTERM protein
MGNMKLRVADNSTILRFYPFVEYLIESPGGEAETGTTPNVTRNATTPTKTPAPNVTVTTPPVGQTGVPPTAGTPAATTTKKTEPGFEAIFAIAGLLAVAFLVLRQRK